MHYQDKEKYVLENTNVPRRQYGIIAVIKINTLSK
jgi:hypothetical protein